MTDPMTTEELQACRERAEATVTPPHGQLVKQIALGQDVPALLATIAALETDLFRVAESLGRVQYPDGHAPYRGSVEDMVSRAEGLTRSENARGDAMAAFSEHRHAALMAAGIHGGPGAWRWAHDSTGTTLGDEAAWERLLGEMRARTGRAEPAERKPVAGWVSLREEGDMFALNLPPLRVVAYDAESPGDRGFTLTGESEDESADLLSRDDFASLNAMLFAAEDALFAIADAINALRAPAPPRPLVREGRCAVCGWPLKATIEDGCTAESCSYQPEQGSDEWHRIQERRKALAELAGPIDDWAERNRELVAKRAADDWQPLPAQPGGER